MEQAHSEVRIVAAGRQDLEILLPLVEAYHQCEGLALPSAQRRAALSHLLADPGLGHVWMIYAAQCLVGYLVLCKSFSLEFGGFDAFIDELFIQPSQRNRGIGRQVLALLKSEARRLALHALHLEVAKDNPRAAHLYAVAGFQPRDKYQLMSLIIDES